MSPVYKVLLFVYVLSSIACGYFLIGILFPRSTIMIETKLGSLVRKGEIMIIVTKEALRSHRKRNLILFALFLTVTVFLKAVLNQLILSG